MPRGQGVNGPQGQVRKDRIRGGACLTSRRGSFLLGRASNTKGRGAEERKVRNRLRLCGSSNREGRAAEGRLVKNRLRLCGGVSFFKNWS